MKRREFLSLLPAVGATALSPSRARAADAAAPFVSDRAWRTFQVTTRLEIVTPDAPVRVWVPLPLDRDTDYFRLLDKRWEGNALAVTRVVEPRYGGTMLAASFAPDQATPVLELHCRIQLRDRTPGERAADETGISPAERSLYLQATDFLPTHGTVRQLADDITHGLDRDRDKARAIYDWVIENTARDPEVRGCGTGDVNQMLESRTFRGKCADLNGLFVALCRSAGVPARDVYGLRVAPSRLGFSSMGRAGDVSKAQHCRAEFYEQGAGWVPADPADVRKVILEEPGALRLEDARVQMLREYLFGRWEGNWLPYNTAHDVNLPDSKGGRLPFLMYPQAEGSTGRRDALDPAGFRYRIQSQEES
jgi:transglutaminase-like putative cysteine protease